MAVNCSTAARETAVIEASVKASIALSIAVAPWLAEEGEVAPFMVLRRGAGMSVGAAVFSVSEGDEIADGADVGVSGGEPLGGGASTVAWGKGVPSLAAA